MKKTLIKTKNIFDENPCLNKYLNKEADFNGECDEFQKKLLKVLDSMEAIIYVSDIDTHDVLFANKYAQDLWGESRGRKCWEYLNNGKSDPCAYCENKKRHVASGNLTEGISSEFYNQFRDRWYYTRSRLIEWTQGYVACLEIIVDITKHKKTEKALKESEERYRELVDGTDDLITRIDSNGRFLYVNDAAMRIFGVLKEECVGLFAFDFVHPDDRKRTRIAFDGWLRDHIRSVTFENAQMHRDGTVFDMLWTINLHYDKEGSLLGANFIGRDITKRKKAEDKLKKLQSDLKLEQLKLDQVLGIGQEMSSILNLNNLVDFVINKAIEILDVEKCSLMLLDSDSQELAIRGAKGLEDEIIKKTRVKVGEQISGLVAELGKPILVNDIENNSCIKRKRRDAYRSSAFMSAPIKVRNEIMGVINVADKRSGKNDIFTKIDLKILCAIVRQASIVIENASSYQQLEHLSHEDSLTEIYNHRYFVKVLDQEIDRLKRYPNSLCLLMFDMDDFKSYNDTYGHLEGDRLLKEASLAVKTELRAVDIMCRYAGDEFVIILPETDIKQALVVADKIRSAVENMRLKRKITISIGLASCAKNNDRRDLILKADQALYHSKKEGRNKVTYLKNGTFF